MSVGATLHADAVTTLTGWQPPSAEQGRLRERYLAHLSARPDAMTRACLPAHLTASTLVLDEAGHRVLLTLHAKSGRWFQLGGHAEEQDTSLAAAALREAVEESGIAAEDLALDPVPVVLDEHPVPFCSPGADTRHLDVMFVATAREGAAHEVSEESLDVAWWPVTGLPDAELEPFVALALARRRPQPASSAASASAAPASAPSVSLEGGST